MLKYAPHAHFSHEALFATITQMYSRLRLAGLLAFVLAISSLRAFPAPATQPLGPHIVMIIRHAEKPDETDGIVNINLSKQGFERAAALAKVIPDNFPHPDFLIATKQSKNSNRPAETITPLSQALHEPIESTFKDDQFDQLAKEILADPKYAGKTVLISFWHHVENSPSWAGAFRCEERPG